MIFLRHITVLITLVGLAYAAYPAVYGENGVVVARDLHACEAGVSILKAGGNAVDAAIAVSYALAVTHPQAGNIGGGGFMVIQMADGRRSAIDYREMAPSASDRDMFLDDSGRVMTSRSRIGGLANGVPGTVAGMELALDTYGTLSRRKLMNPAIKLASRGFDVSYGLASSLRTLDRSARQFPETRRVFCRNGDTYQPGERFKQPDLAKTLKLIRRKGPDGFYQGKVAQALVETNNSHGGIISLEDMANYKAVMREPVVGNYRGFEILSMPPPSSGGIALISMLNMLELSDFDSISWHSAEHIHLLSEVEKRAYADRSAWLGDADYFDVPQEQLISKDYATQRMATFSAEIATPADSINPLNDKELRDINKAPYESEETTHFSVVDKWGNAVSVTTTLNWSFGSKVTVKGFGFLLNNEMDDFSSKPGVPNSFGLLGAEANAVEPGKRMLSSMTPTIINQEGEVKMVVGAPGGSTIITTVLQTIHNVIDYDMDLQNAINAPRFHHQWHPDTIFYAFGALNQDTSDKLEALGYTLERRSSYGEVNAIIRDKRFGGWIGAPDYRRSAHALAY
ncbi:MAG: gamma-glutamyltransferase [Candidatus Marinimicrobia bacterium]|nr:gamma-glutamyltransferase [Candidatus Neomarinimicrobiota bacterium]MCF7850966.1 gamma-glutamyltransferase [Candidatus Neomarinimicrobiota bacterium]